MVPGLLFNRLLPRAFNWRYVALVALLPLPAHSEDFGTSTTHETASEASLACTNARNAWLDVLGVTSGDCNTVGTFYRTLKVVYNNVEEVTVQRFYWKPNGVSTSELQSDLDDLTTLTLAINDDLAAAEATIIDYEPRIDNLETRADQTDQNILVLNSEINDLEVDVDLLNDRAALIEIDTNQNANDITQLQTDLNTVNLASGINATNIASNVSAIVANELYIEGVEQQQLTYETARAASDAQTNNYLTAQQLPQLQDINAELDTQTLLLQQIEDASDSMELLQQQTETAVDQLEGFSLQNRNYNQATSGYALTSRNHLDNIRANTSTANLQLTAIETAISGLATPVVTVDNTSIENRLDTINDTLTIPIPTPTNTIQTVATYADAINNFKATLDAAPVSQMATGIATAFSSLPVGTCPSPTFDLSNYFGTSVTVTEHCNLKATAKPIIDPIMALLWSLLGIRMILSA